MTGIRETARRALANAGSLAIFRIVADVALLAFYVGLTRHFGPTGVGLYAYGMALTSLLCSIPQFASAKYLVRVGSHAPERLAQHWAVAQRLSFLGLVASAAAMAPLLWILPPEQAVIVALLGLTQLCYFGGESYKALFAIEENQWRIAPLELVYKGTILAIALPLMLTGAPLAGVLGAFPIAGALYFAILVVMSRRLRARPAQVQWRALREALPRWAPFLATTLMEAFLYRQYPILLAELQGLRLSGLFAAAFKLIEAVLLCLGFVGNALLAPLSRLHRHTPESHLALLAGTLRYMLILGFPAALCTAFAAPWAIELLYGEQFEGATLVLQLLGIAIVLQPLRQLLMVGLNSVGRTWSWTGTQATSLGVALTAAVPLILTYGAEGAAVSMLLGECAGCLFAFAALNRAGVRLQMGSLLWKLVLAGSAAAAVVVLVAPDEAMERALVAFAAFAGAGIGLGIVGRADVRAWRRLVSDTRR